MLSQSINDALNDQLQKEFSSSYIYLAMSAYFQEKSFDGFAHWMYIQAQEELFHAQKFYQFIGERGGQVILHAIEKPSVDWKNVTNVFEQALNHEQFITRSINEIVDLAIKESDHATHAFLQWFVSEQVEEEDSVNDLLGKLKIIQGEGQGLLLLDRECLSRTFVPPQN